MSTHRNQKRRWVKPATVAVGTALVATMTAAPAYAWHLHSTVSGNIKHADFMPAAQRAAAQGDGENILIIGGNTKAMGGDGAGMFVLAHVSADRQRVDLVQFPRDMKVKGSSELKSVYGMGGEKRVTQSIERMTDVQVDHVAKVGFDNVRDLVNTVGGVELDGQRMTGEQALDWMGSEDTTATTKSSDINQGDRQLTFLKAVLTQAVSTGVLADPAKLSQYLDVATREVTVDKNWQVTEMEKLALSLKDVSASNVHTWTAPTKDRAALADLGENLANDTMSQYTS